MVATLIRPTWTEYYLGIADAVAKRGECTRRQVGAVIVNHHTIIATGYKAVHHQVRSHALTACVHGRGVMPPLVLGMRPLGVLPFMPRLTPLFVPVGHERWVPPCM